MSHFTKYLFLSLFIICLNSETIAEEFKRLRYLVPYSTENQITRNYNNSKVSLDSIGSSGNLIFSNGIGLGFNTSRLKGIFEGVSYKFKNHSLDLSYTIGGSLSCTLGFGRLIYGRGELTYNGNNFVTERSIGESLFFDFGIPFFLGELIFGYRRSFSKYDNFQAKINDESEVLEDSLKLVSSKIYYGIGFIF